MNAPKAAGEVLDQPLPDNHPESIYWAKIHQHWENHHSFEGCPDLDRLMSPPVMAADSDGQRIGRLGVRIHVPPCSCINVGSLKEIQKVILEHEEIGDGVLGMYEEAMLERYGDGNTPQWVRKLILAAARGKALQ